MTGSLAFWRTAFALAVHASSAVARLVRATEARFYDACLRETLTRPATESEREAQRRSFAYGQVAMHDPTITRAQVDAVADRLPSRDGEVLPDKTFRGVDDPERGSTVARSGGPGRQSTASSVPGDPPAASAEQLVPSGTAGTSSAAWSCLAGDLDGHDAGEIDERDLHDGEGWRVSRGQRNGWEA